MNRSIYSVLITVVIIMAVQDASAELNSPPSPAPRLNSTVSLRGEFTLHNSTDSTVETRISTILRDLPTIKNIVIFVCVVTTLLITCLLVRVYRSGKKIRKTRKYDIITTPAERVEMAPLNEENDDEDDSTLFDVKYR